MYTAIDGLPTFLPTAFLTKKSEQSWSEVYNNSILLCCAQNYYRTFILVNSDKTPSIIFCTAQQYTIIIK